MKLKERIGIDHSVLYNFSILSINQDKLYNQQTNANTYINLVIDDTSPIVLSDSTKISKLVIKDGCIGRFGVEYKQNNLTGTYCINTALEMMVSDDNNNLQNLMVTEYRQRIDSIFAYLDNKYGVQIDYSNLKIKKIELNATFSLDAPYEQYKQSILLMAQNIPHKFATKYATWNEISKTGAKLETLLIKNSSTELKIYNKAKHLQDIGVMDISQYNSHGIMRIEYTIKDKRILEHNFKSNLVEDLTDEQINNLFKTYFKGHIIEPYQEWKEKNKLELIKRIKKSKENNQKWMNPFLRECREYTQIYGMPILFDIADTEPIFKELESKTGRNATKKYKKFKMLAENYEKDLMGNTEKMNEIIGKIMKM